ncbi:AAA family ATPase [Sphingomonas crocodyli]|nr:AAA family ATPase [Sphingomonas crocodyli]
MSSGQHTAFTEKYRPRTFEEVIGQEAAVSDLRRRVETRNFNSIIAFGPPGTGKTTLMRIFANAMHCENPNPSPCGRCDICIYFKEERLGDLSFYHVEMNGARHHERDYAKQIEAYNSARLTRLLGIFIDEVHGLDDNAADVLLKAVERPSQGTFFMFASSEAHEVRPALKSRCLQLNLKLLSGAESYRLLSQICDREGIQAERAALEMLVTAGQGSARELVKLLDQANQQGPLTVKLLTNVLSLGWIQELLGYFDALLTGTLLEQDQIIADWHDQPSRKGRAIRDFLVYLHDMEIMRSGKVVDPAFHQVTHAQRQQIIAALEIRALDRRKPLGEYLLDLADFWRVDLQTLADGPSLSIHIRKFNNYLNPPSLSDLIGGVVPSQQAQRVLQSKRPGRMRSARTFNPIRSGGAPATREYLSVEQARGIYAAASFLPQHYGSLFNAHLKLDHSLLGATDRNEVTNLVSKLTHQIGIRVPGWSGKDAHWIYLHTASSIGPTTDIVLHLPVDVEGQARAWFEKVMRKWRGPAADNEGAWSFEHMPLSATRARVKLHWRLVRYLWRGIDPDVDHWQSVDQESRRALIDLLRVPRNQQGSIGAAIGRRFNTSASIGPDERASAEKDKMLLLSAFDDCAWGYIDTGWELKEAIERRIERGRRAEDIAYVNAMFESEGPDNEMKRARLVDLMNEWPDDPHSRIRVDNSWKWGGGHQDRP